MCPGQFLKDGLKKQNAIYSDSGAAQAELKNRSEISSLYEEIFQHKSTVPNDKMGQLRVSQSGFAEIHKLNYTILHTKYIF